jgi:diguanylate cyclase (GGDEF)-like protein
MERLKTLLLSNEQWLMERILAYAKRQSYTKYTSTLAEAWRLSISGLTESIVRAIDTYGNQMPEFFPDANYRDNPISEFGTTEARQHRKRGISLGMFLGLLKYYRLSYQDLVRKEIETNEDAARYECFIVRCFDLFELALSVEWNSIPGDEIIDELQRTSRQLVNEKNRYLTLFESLSDPAFLINADALIINLNLAAARWLEIESTPGGIYYDRPDYIQQQQQGNRFKNSPNRSITGKPLWEIIRWLSDMLAAVRKSENKVLRQEISAEIDGSAKHFLVSISGMLDVSGKYDGAVVVISDITARKQMDAEIRTLASIDPLTGAKNRRNFMEQAKAEWDRCRRFNRFLSVLMIDIDHFKKINDTYGHHMGDLTLKAFTQTCLEVLREHDLFGRIGGEEFAAIIVEADEKKARQVAKRLRITAAKTIVKENAVSFNFQISIGVAQFKGDNETIEDILKRADQALYQAKHLGRNRVISASELLV